MSWTVAGNAHLTDMMEYPQPYATLPVTARKEPDILCRFPEPANDNPYSAGHASGDCPLRMVPQSRESLGGRKRDRARADGPGGVVRGHRPRDARRARGPLAVSARPDWADALHSGA